MPKVLLTLDTSTACFYRRLAEAAQLPLEQVLSDTLFKLAAELALESLEKRPRSGR